MEYALNKRHVKLVETGLDVGNEGFTKLVYKCDGIVARDLPGGKRILAINMMAQHITFSKAIKPVKI